jgi:hypothetical protein
VLVATREDGNVGPGEIAHSEHSVTARLLALDAIAAISVVQKYERIIGTKLKRYIEVGGFGQDPILSGQGCVHFLDRFPMAHGL